jgi:hypothetical protein
LRTAAAVIDRLHVCARGTRAAGLNHLGDRFGRTRKDRFNRAVAAIANPALEALFECGIFGPGAKADPLHAAANDYIPDRVWSGAHPMSPVSLGKTPAQPAGDHRCKDLM